MQYLINVIPAEITTTYNDLNWNLARYGAPVQISPFSWVIYTELDSESLCVVTKKYLNDGDAVFACNFEFWNQRGLPQEIVKRLNN